MIDPVAARAVVEKAKAEGKIVEGPKIPTRVPQKRKTKMKRRPPKP